MRKIDTVRNKSIRTERDLAVALEKALRSDADLAWRITRGESAPNNADAVIQLTVGDLNLKFLAEFTLEPTADLVETLAHRAVPRNCAWMLVTPRLTDRLTELCRQAGVACVDLNGRVWIRRGTVFVDRAPAANRERVVVAAPELDVFSDKSSRIVRAFLSPRESWTQADLAATTGVSRPRLSKVLDRLAQLGFVRREGSRRGGTWIAAQPDALLDHWAKQDVWSRRVEVQQYSILVGDVEQAAQELHAALASSQRIAFTQWIAARLRHPYTESGIVSAYVERVPPESALKALVAREVDSGGRLWLLRPRDGGVFQFTQNVNGLPLAADAQIYLDLLQVGQRGPDAADALRRWEGFRR